MSKEKKQFDFIGKQKIFYVISLSIMAIGLLFNIIFGVELDTSFKGGTLLKYSYQGEMDKGELEKFVEDTLGKKIDVQYASSIEETSFNVSLADALTLDEQKSLENALQEKYADQSIKNLAASSIAPSMGMKFFLKCMVAIVLASVFLVIYVALRFRKIGGVSAGVMALVALLHDVLIAYFTFVIFRIPLNDNFVAVVLSILGYSLNDTIVIYDRIRENRRTMDSKTGIGVIVNTSINQSFTRSFNTSLCTFLAIGTVAVLALVNGLTSIVSFAVPMMIGVISGCYSTVCICGPLWVRWKEYRQKKQAKA